MTSVSALFAEIFAITGSDRENACFPYVGAAEYIKNLAPVRLTRISEFWKGGDSEDPAALFRTTEEFVGGLFGQGCEWNFLLRGLPTEIQCWIATEDRKSVV